MATPSTGRPGPATTIPPLDPKDAGILEQIEKWEAACKAKDVAAQIACCAPNVTWHADLVTLNRDIHGTAALSAFLEAYPKGYNYTHASLGVAVDGSAGFGFTIGMDTDVSPKPDGPHADQAGCPPSTTLSLTYLVFERPEAGGGGGGEGGGEGGGGEGAGGGEAGASEGATSAPPTLSDVDLPKITDVFCQREMSVDECIRKHGAPPADYTRVLEVVPLDLLQSGSGGKHTPERAAKHAIAAEAINEAWRTGDAAPALPHLADDFVRVNALTGAVVRGPAAFKAMLDHVFEKYELLYHSSCIAVTPGNKAVTFFTAAAQMGGDFVQPSGQSILVFNKDDQVTHAIEFSTPLPGLKAKLFKRGPEAEAEVEQVQLLLQQQQQQGETMATEAGGGGQEGAAGEAGAGAAGKAEAAAQPGAEELRAAGA